MNHALKIFLIAGFIAVFFQAQAAGDSLLLTPSTPSYYKYAHNDAEYSVMLPEAPSVETIWDDAGPIPYLKSSPGEGDIGEIATFRRKDIETGDSFSVKITFLKAGHDFLAGLTEDKIKAEMENDFKDIDLTDRNFSSSSSKGALKWMTLTGFSTDQNKHPFYNAEHFLTGLHSIMVMRVQYSVENKVFQSYYKPLTDSITYNAP